MVDVLMATHSHSSLERFEKCPLAYRMRYIDRIRDRLGESLEQHLGKCVHSTLEWIHLRVHDGILPLWAEILDDFLKRYDGGWTDSIRLVHTDRTRESYRLVGERCLRNYFEANTPFDEGSLVGAEWDFRFPISRADGSPLVTGKVDRITRLAPGRLQVHDYKTSSFVPARHELERSRQPALYVMAIRRAYPDAASGRVELVWHYLNSGIMIRFDMTTGGLERIRRQTEELIETVQACTDFPARPTRLCAWCEYGHLCPENEYREKVRASLDGEREPEPGIDLVDRLERLTSLRREFEKSFREEKARIERTIASHASEQGVNSVLGTRMEAVVTDGAKVRLRRKR
ncbi:MAG: PD-(D/E)XK nuclease family protein [Deltaproteobacteria bacterium]|nr:PD-(D/E)XK nuclease family protein [Deltaproteobacteria bacterium]